MYELSALTERGLGVPAPAVIVTAVVASVVVSSVISPLVGAVPSLSKLVLSLQERASGVIATGGEGGGDEQEKREESSGRGVHVGPEGFVAMSRWSN
jgi:hypothetical protein